MTVANNTTDLRYGVTGELGCKAPCRGATITNITLEGEQTANGIAFVANDIALVNGQTDTTENGVYIVSTSGWTRAIWFDDILDAKPGTLVVTAGEGTLYPNTIFETICADNPIVFGTSAITFQVKASGTNTGDITLAGQTYLTLVNQVITAAKITLANMADLAANSFIANNTGTAGAPLALTQAQATALLNDFAGDSGSGGTKGMVPAPAAGDTAADKFLKADGTWETPPEATQATEILAGIAELATQAETNAGTDDLRIVTPLKLATKPGLTVQIVNSQTGAFASGPTTIPLDDTDPQNNEGTEFMSASITPTNANNQLRIDVLYNGGNSTNQNGVTTALFQDSIASALCAASFTFFVGDVLQQNSLTHYMTAGTTSAITFKVRCGASAAGTTYLNGSGGARLFGGVLISSITITEIKA